MNYSSQYGQDEFLDKNFFKEMRNGFFLEIGADDGVAGSNTLFFERSRGWKGICVEPRTEAFKMLTQNRTAAICENVCISNRTEKREFLEVGGNAGQLSGLIEHYDKRHLERIQKETDDTTLREIECVTLNDLLKKHSILTIDYLSLDIEGGELDILKSIDYHTVTIKCMTVENNYKNTAIRQFLASKGYRKAAEVGIDEIYVLKNSAYDRYREPLQVKVRRRYRAFKDMIKMIIHYNK